MGEAVEQVTAQPPKADGAAVERSGGYADAWTRRDR